MTREYHQRAVEEMIYFHPTVIKMRVSQPAASDLDNSHEMFHEVYAQASDGVRIPSCAECQYHLFDHLLRQRFLNELVALPLKACG